MTAQIINFAQAKRRIEAKNMKAGQAVWEYGLRQPQRKLGEIAPNNKHHKLSKGLNHG